MSAPTFRPVARPRPPVRPPSVAGPWQAGAVAGAWALVLGLVAVGLPVLVVWAADARSSAGALTAVRTAGQVWLLAHGTTLDLPAGRLSLVPLGLVVLPLALLLRAGSQAARQHGVRDLRGAAVLTAAVGVPYALAASVVAAVSPTSAARPSVLGALAAAATLALVASGAGVLRAAGLTGAAAGLLPGTARRLAVPAGAAVLVLLAAGALLAGTRLALEAGQASDLARAGSPGAVGGVALLLLGVALVPNAVVWGATWWAGPGFAVGAGTAVGPLALDLGPVPGLPLLAALPSSPLPGWLGVLVLLVPVGAGVLTGLLVVHGGSPAPVRDAGLSGGLAGLAVGALAWLSQGAAGGARLAEVGPSAWRCALAVAVAVAVSGCIVAWWRTRTA